MPDESEGDYAETDWRSIYVASFVAFCIAAQYSLYFTSMWPYLKTIDEHVTEQFFGLVVAVYSLSSCIASPIFGYWSNRIKQIRLPLNVGIAFMTVGDIIYFSSELVPSERRYVLFAARLITGVGSANLPLLRAYASTACNPKDRPRSTALITGGICFGILVGPAFQLLCTPLSYPGLVIFRHFSINMYTASAYGSCIMNIISFTCLKCLFVEKYAGIHSEYQRTDEAAKLPRFDIIAAFICNCTKFIQQLIFTNAEMIGAPYAMTIFAYTKQKALQTNSIAQSIFGIIALIVFAVFIGFKLDKHVKYRIGTIITFIVILAFLLITFPWPFLTERIVMFSGSDAVNSTKEMTGCDTDTLKWCAKTKAVNPWVYYVSYTITMGFGFPVMDICLNTVYGRVLGPRRQGTMQGLLRVSGSIARMVGPLVVSVLFASYGPTVVWIAQLAVVAVVMLMWIVFYRRMVALKIVAVDRKISALSSTLTRADTVFPDRSSVPAMSSEKGAPEKGPKTEWRSIYTASFLSFCAAVQFSIFFTSMWPYLETIDQDATEEFFGYIVATFSVAQSISSPLFGYWSNRIKQVRLPMVIGIVAMFFGNLIYLSCELLPTHRRYALLVGRFLTGIGAANVSLLRAYTSTACNPKDRPRAMSFVTGGIATGTMIGPALQLFFTPISYPGLVLFPNFSISMYTACAYSACVMNVVSLICVHYVFVEKYAGLHEAAVKKSEDANEAPQKVKLPQFDRLAAFLCNFTKFSQQFIFTNIEIIGSPYAMTVFAFTNQQTIQIGSIAQSGVGVCALIIFVAFITFKLNKYVKYRPLMLAALSLLLVFLLLTFPWPFPSDQITTYSSSDVVNMTEEVVGCNVDKLDWCVSTPRVNPWLYYTAFILCIGISYPMTDISLNTLYGRILGPRRQGTMQGLLQLSSGMARILGPVSISLLYVSYGPRVIWILESIIMIITVGAWIVCYKRMVELRIPTPEKQGSEDSSSDTVRSEDK